MSNFILNQYINYHIITSKSLGLLFVPNAIPNAYPSADMSIDFINPSFYCKPTSKFV
jgi:hypothetical protein